MTNARFPRLSLLAAGTIASFSARADMFDEWQQTLPTPGPGGKPIIVRFWRFSVASLARSVPNSFETTLPNPFLGKSDALPSIPVVDSLLDRPGRMSIGGQWVAVSKRATVSE